MAKVYRTPNGDIWDVDDQGGARNLTGYGETTESSKLISDIETGEIVPIELNQKQIYTEDQLRRMEEFSKKQN